ncbi:aldehyde dehydrogenase family protein [Pseudonocardia halophobica]|uniref:aldehyde dehydrogenase family protein n=1 Tax=Pseudonocardia halophobica TaxID=29401 RepID=UPI003D89E43C
MFGEPDHALALARRLRTGQVDVDGGTFTIVAPSGGYKQSGNGRELGRCGLEEFLETKSIQRRPSGEEGGGDATPGRRIGTAAPPAYRRSPPSSRERATTTGGTTTPEPPLQNDRSGITTPTEDRRCHSEFR